MGDEVKTTEQRSSYRQIFKATSLFGGVQVSTILIGIVRVKFVAVLLGAAGVGIIGLLNTPIDLIIAITGLGISFSAVRDISKESGHADPVGLARIIMTLRRWSWFTGLLGAVVTIALAPMLSQWSFGNSEYTWSFIWLSVTLLLYAVSRGQNAVLQGTRRLKDMAKSTVIGSFLGLITSIPLYYWLGVKGIVPAMLISAVTTLFLSWYFARRVEIEKVQMSTRETYRSGLNMAKLGISMTIAGFIASLSRYVLNAFISHQGGIDQVGLYNAGWGVVGQYTAIVFSAMATDYFPRLSAIQEDNKKVRELVGQQIETAVLILTPLLSLLIVMMPLVVRVLYTKEFLPMIMFAYLTIMGIHFKTLSWGVGYVFLAKGNGRLFLILEIISGVIILGLNLLGYSLYGLNGLGISFILSYLTTTIIAFVVVRSVYHIQFPARYFFNLFIAYLFLVLAFTTVFLQDTVYRYAAGIVVLLIATAFSLYKLNELMDIKAFIRSKLKRQ
jgi:O-antigen/teichoic acid export membrane protein